jgi:hypothetical protein
MEQHTLLGRTEDEVTWFKRRSFLSAAAAWTALGGYEAAHAQQRSNVVELTGDAEINGRRLLPQQTIQSGDAIATGPGSNLVFVIGKASFQVRQNSRLIVERGNTLSIVGVLRLLTGGVASVWGKGQDRRIITPTMTAGIRGTGVYTEVLPAQDNRTYFCNCYGVVELRAGDDRQISRADYHQSFWGETRSIAGRTITPAKALNHTDEEMEFLARLIEQRTTWQTMGKKGSKDGRGYMDDNVDGVNPASVFREAR